MLALVLKYNFYALGANSNGDSALSFKTLSKIHHTCSVQSVYYNHNMVV